MNTTKQFLINFSQYEQSSQIVYRIIELSQYDLKDVIETMEKSYLIFIETHPNSKILKNTVHIKIGMYLREIISKYKEKKSLKDITNSQEKLDTLFAVILWFLEKSKKNHSFSIISYQSIIDKYQRLIPTNSTVLNLYLDSQDARETKPDPHVDPYDEKLVLNYSLNDVIELLKPTLTKILNKRIETEQSRPKPKLKNKSKPDSKAILPYQPSEPYVYDNRVFNDLKPKFIISMAEQYLDNLIAEKAKTEPLWKTFEHRIRKIDLNQQNKAIVFKYLKLKNHLALEDDIYAPGPDYWKDTNFMLELNYIFRKLEFLMKDEIDEKWTKIKETWVANAHFDLVNVLYKYFINYALYLKTLTRSEITAMTNEQKHIKLLYLSKECFED